MADCVKYKEHYITIDSRERNRILWPSPSQFQIYLTSNVSYDDAPEDTRYEGIRQVEVIDVQFPNRNHVIAERYLYLTIPEIGGSLDATETTGAAALAKLIPSRLIGTFVQVHFEADKRPKKTFDFSGLTTPTLTVELRKKDGSLFSFGTDTMPPTPIRPELQTSITLRILTQW